MHLLLILTAILFAATPALAADALPGSAFFPVLPLDAPPDTMPQLIPLAANHSFEGVHKGITRAILIIHDEQRDVNASLTALSTLAGAANASTMILAPQFLLGSDLVQFADHLPDHGHDFAAWQTDAWQVGDNSLPPPARKGISSFTVVDLLLMYLSDRSSYPDLQTIILVGTSAGAKFVQHYAAFSLAAEVVTKENIDLRFLVVDAPSFLYLTDNRPLGGRKGFGRPDTAACPSYDAYPYGLESLNDYARRVGANAAKTHYDLRLITYLSAPSTATSDTSCAALTQGADILTRTLNFETYLQTLYGDAAERSQAFIESKDPVASAVSLLGSSCGMEILFGDGLCPHAFGERK